MTIKMIPIKDGSITIPDSLDLRVAPRVAAAVAEAAISGDLAHNPIDPREVEMRCRELVYEGTVGL
jgi:malic enzyme